MTLSLAWSLGLSDRTNNQSLHKPTEWSHTLLTFGTFDQSDEEAWPDQKRPTYLPTWHLIVTLDSIRNSCDVCYMCLLWVVAKFSPLASMVVVGMNACGPSPIPPFHLKEDLQEEEKPKSWDLPRTWQLATHRICRNTFHLCLLLRLPLHSQDSLKTRVWIWHEVTICSSIPFMVLILWSQPCAWS